LNSPAKSSPGADREHKRVVEARSRAKEATAVQFLNDSILRTPDDVREKVRKVLDPSFQRASSKGKGKKGGQSPNKRQKPGYTKANLMFEGGTVIK
jgi:hypothetical protein